MRLLLDQGIPTDAAKLLRDVGHECFHVAEIGMQQAEDEAILALAAEKGAIIVTLDSDFHMLIAVRSLRGPSAVRLRREGCRAEAVTSLIQETLLRYESALMHGCLISIKERKTTIHRLPIGVGD